MEAVVERVSEMLYKWAKEDDTFIAPLTCLIMVEHVMIHGTKRERKSAAGKVYRRLAKMEHMNPEYGPGVHKAEVKGLGYCPRGF